MDYSRAALVVCVTLFIVVGVNAAIYVSITRRNSRNKTVGQIELMRRAARRMRDPWEQENTDLRELSDRVKALKEKSSPGRKDVDPKE